MLPPVLEPDRVRREHHQTSVDQCRPERLGRVACQPADFGLAQVPLPGVLVKHHHSRRVAHTFRHQQEGRHLVPVRADDLQPHAPTVVDLHDIDHLDGHVIRRQGEIE